MISPKSVVKSCGCFSNIYFGGGGLPAADMANCQATRPDQHVFAISSQVEKCLYSLRGTA